VVRVLPKVVLYDAVSLDGRVEGFAPDIGRFYSLARWGEDVILAGADTMLAGGEADAARDDPHSPAPAPAAPDAKGPLLAITDSRGRVRSWDWIRAQQPFWRDAVALVSDETPGEYRAHLDGRGVRTFAAGSGHVDLRAALEWLESEYGARVVRVESGGALNTALLRQGLATELALLVHPALAGEDARSFVRGALSTSVPLTLRDCEVLDDGLVWLRYEVTGTSA
jgi:2,5-diamino-6-(ribosylamino)-4(3H)-pyrimidinone 5'-phosphate reductase